MLAVMSVCMGTEAVVETICVGSDCFVRVGVGSIAVLAVMEALSRESGVALPWGCCVLMAWLLWLGLKLV